MAYVENGAGRLETRNWLAEFGIEFQNSDRFTLALRGQLRIAAAGRSPLRRVSSFPIGQYDFANMRVGVQRSASQRSLSGTISVEHGSFYSGHKTAVGVSRGRVNFTPQLSVEPTYSVNKVDLVEGVIHDAPRRLTHHRTRLRR